MTLPLLMVFAGIFSETADRVVIRFRHQAYEVRFPLLGVARIAAVGAEFL